MNLNFSNNKIFQRINFSRVEWHVTVINNTYHKIPNVPEENWVWSSQYTINMHHPERWGYVQFSKERFDLNFLCFQNFYQNIILFIYLFIYFNK